MRLLHESFAWLARFSQRDLAIAILASPQILHGSTGSQSLNLTPDGRAIFAELNEPAKLIITPMRTPRSGRCGSSTPFGTLGLSLLPPSLRPPQAVGRVNFVIKRSHPNEHWPCTRFRCTTTKPLSSITQQMARARTVADYIIAEPDFAPIFDILQNVFAAFVQYFQRWRMTSWRLSMRVTVNLRERCGSLAGCRPKHAYLPPAPLGPISLLRNHRQQP